MKKYCLTAILVVALLLTGCGTPGVQIMNMKRSAPAEEKEDMIKYEVWQKQVLNFAFDTSGYIEEDTFIYSPFSLYLALGCLAEGASDEVKEELKAVLAGTDLTLEDVNQLSRQYIDELQTYASLNMRLNTLITVNQEYTLDKEFAQNAVDYYNGDTATADFSKEEAKKTLNQWIEEQTNGLIQDMIGDEVNESTVMVLLNAVYYQGRWSQLFDSGNTKEGIFHGASGDTTVDMMYMESQELYYGETDDYEMVTLYYQDQAAAMHIFLPKEGKTLQELKDTLKGTTFVNYPTEKRPGNLTLPKFTLETNLDLEKLLANAGAGSIFQGGLTKIVTGDQELFVDSAKQKAKVIVDEEGTEAAAVTEITTKETAMEAPAEPFSMKVDRPFLFVLEINRMPAFIGQVNHL